MPVAELMLTKMMNNGSRKRIPGNIWVDSTVVVKTPRPRNRKRDTANAAMIARMTLATVAQVQMIRLFTKYRASGTVDHMSMNGWMVRFVGHHVKVPWTSARGLSEELTIA